MLFSEALMFFYYINPPNRMQIQIKNDNKFILDTLSYSPFLLLHSSVWETKHFLALIVIWNPEEIAEDH